MDEAQLQTIWQQRQPHRRAAHLSEPIALLMKHKLGKRVKQLAKLGEIWDEIIPQEISEHTALDSYARSVLTVLVDSAAHRFQLRTLLDGGLKREIQQRFTGPIDKIRLVPGQFYAVDINGDRRYEV
jgi:hypothetical protein